MIITITAITLMYQNHCWDCTTSKTYNLPPGYKYILTPSIQIVGGACGCLRVSLSVYTSYGFLATSKPQKISLINKTVSGIANYFPVKPYIKVYYTKKALIGEHHQKPLLTASQKKH